MKIALLDMDGTIVDYDGGMSAIYDRLIGPGELTYVEACNLHGRMTLPDYIWNRCQVIKAKAGWWRELQVLPVGAEIFTVLKQLGYKVHIATRGPKEHNQAWSEKVDWVRKHVPFADVIHVTEDKSSIRGDVLVDDWPSYCDKWQARNPDGLVVMPAHDYNKQSPYFRYELGMQAQLEQLLKQR